MFKTSIYRYVDRCWFSMVSNKYSFENCKKKRNILYILKVFFLLELYLETK